MAVVSLTLLAVGAMTVLAALAVRMFFYHLKILALESAVPGPTPLPILGNLLSFVGATGDDIMERLLDLWTDRTELFRYRILNYPFLIVNNARDLGVLMKRKDLADKSRFYYELLAEIAPNGLVMTNETVWKAHRMATQPAFHAEVLDSYMDVFVEESERYVANLEIGKEVDVRTPLLLALSKAFMRTAMVADVQQEDEEALAFFTHFADVYLRALNYRAFKPWLWPRLVFRMTDMGRQTEAALELVHGYCRRVIQRRKVALANDHKDSSDFLPRRKTLLDVLLSAENDNKHEMKEADIIDEIVTFLGAAVETSSSNLGMAFKIMSMRKDIQEKLYAEVEEVLGSDSKRRSVTIADLPRLVYLEQVIKETLRLIPAIPFIARQVKEDTEFIGKPVPGGTTLVISFFSIHRNPEVWPKPLEFDPERFSEERSRGRHPFAFVPFSAGSRNCIGGRYAMMTLKTVLATVIRDYRIEPNDDGITDPTQLKLTFDLATRIVGGTKVRFERRTAAAPTWQQTRSQGEGLDTTRQ